MRHQGVAGTELSDPTGPAAAPAATSPAAGAGRRTSGRLVPAVLGGAVLVVLTALVLTDLRTSTTSTPGTDQIRRIATGEARAALSQLQSRPPAAVRAYRAVRAGLVVIEAKATGSPPFTDLGTGIIIDKHGDVLTALHVVQGVTGIKVVFANGTASTGSIRSVDAAHDIAVLTARPLPAVIVPAVLGGGPRVGDEVFAVGTPLGLSGSISAGVVSGLQRDFPLPGGHTLSGMIQFDAAVNPGSSGGPLVNDKGQVIGIVTGLANPTGADEFAGIGFAVPIATAGRAAGAPPQ